MVKKIKGNIPARAHPPHYMMHRYWGRKAHNVINKYIENYTSEGDTVLDPFMGRGIVLIESAKLKRKGIYLYHALIIILRAQIIFFL